VSAFFWFLLVLAFLFFGWRAVVAIYRCEIMPDLDNGPADDASEHGEPMLADPVDADAELRAKLEITRRQILDSLEKREPGRWK
jgi:hypothetical protein